MARAVKKAYSARHIRDAAERFKVLGEPLRLLILGALADGASRADPLEELTRLNHHALYYHLVLLRAARFIKSKRDGLAVVYTLTVQGRKFWGIAKTLLS